MSGTTSRGSTFYRTLTEAVDDLAQHGFDSIDRLVYWQERIRRAAERELVPLYVLEEELAQTLRAAYRKYVDRGAILKMHPGMSLFTLEKVAPQLRLALDRAIMASANQIKLNREKAIRDTVQRLSGWITSIPIGGSDAVDRTEEKRQIRKSLASLPFTDRRVAIDQGHKFVSNLNQIIAGSNNALAALWHSHWREANYNYRKDHKERDERVYLIKGNWAQEKGLVKAGPAGYFDQITKPGEEVYCRCWATYIYNVRSLPSDLLTDRGRRELNLVSP